MNVIVLDTETTGLNGQACEIAYFSLNENLETHKEFGIEQVFEQLEHPVDVLTFNQRFKPLVPMETGASRINGIYDRDLRDKPCIKTFQFPQETEFMIGHNIAFDKRILNNVDKQNPIVGDNVKLICTKELAQLVIKGQTNNKLVTLIAHLYPEESEQLLANAHTALQDCKLTYLLLVKILEKMPNVKTWDDLAKLCSQGKKTYAELDKVITPLETMPFGKHKGLKFTEIDKDYLIWLRNQNDLSPSLLAALNKQLNNK